MLHVGDDWGQQSRVIMETIFMQLLTRQELAWSYINSIKHSFSGHLPRLPFLISSHSFTFTIIQDGYSRRPIQQADVWEGELLWGRPTTTLPSYTKLVTPFCHAACCSSTSQATFTPLLWASEAFPCYCDLLLMTSNPLALSLVTGNDRR